MPVRVFRTQIPRISISRPHRFCRASMSSLGGNSICVWAPTDAELRASEATLRTAGPLTVTPPHTSPATAHECMSQRISLPLSFHTHTEPFSSQVTHYGDFDPAVYFAALGSRTLGRVLFTARATTSTQSVIQENISRLPDGVVFVTDRQVGGRGRGGNVWDSQPGCLMFSVGHRLAMTGQKLPFIQYLVTLAVVQAVQVEAAKVLPTGAPPLDIRIKWPNDVYSADGLKLAGILCHSSYRDQKFHVTMGIGLNLSNAQPTTCVDALIQGAAGRAGNTTAIEPMRREVVMAGILTRLESMVSRLVNEGFEPFEPEYCAAWMHSGQAVTLQEDGREVQVVIRGLSANGYLLAEDAATGERYELHPDGNSLDFFRGLIRRKFDL